MTTTTKRKTTTTTSTTCCYTATQIAEFLNEATTPSEKGTATRRLNTYIRSRVADGADATRVEANIRGLCRRLGR